MKIVVSIIAFYLLLLQVIPCCAFDDCIDDVDISMNTKEKQDQNQEDCGTCSPFFSCGSCVAISMTTEFISFDILTVMPTRSKVGFIPATFAAVYSECWQPPRLG